MRREKADSSFLQKWMERDGKRKDEERLGKIGRDSKYDGCSTIDDEGVRMPGSGSALEEIEVNNKSLVRFDN